ncbi:MAG TPA: hypothetical protein V6D17_20785 [Candidatus Obscuribacterales bacterium]
MRKVLAATLCSLALTTAGVAPAFAEGDGVASVVVGYPLRAASIATTTVLGTPIALFRSMKHDTCEMTKAMAGDDQNAVLIGFSALAGVPLGMVTGTYKGLTRGVGNAIVHSDKPFSKDQFSLEELGDYLK